MLIGITLESRRTYLMKTKTDYSEKCPPLRMTMMTQIARR